MSRGPLEDRSTPFDGIPTAGRSSSLVRDVRALSGDAAIRRSRRLAIAEGIHLAQEALRRPVMIRHAIVSPRLLRSDDGRRLPARLPGPVTLRLRTLYESLKNDYASAR